VTLERLVGLAIALGLAAFPEEARGARIASNSAGLDRPPGTIIVRGQDVAGSWEGVFRLDSASGLRGRPTARSVRARVHFAAVGDATAAVQTGRSVHGGTFDIDFEPFGFELSTHDALGWSVGADSIRARLNPTVSHGSVELYGARRGERLTGTWRYTSDGGAAMGSFELRRVAPARGGDGAESPRPTT
jgi:hypothetical protein